MLFYFMLVVITTTPGQPKQLSNKHLISNITLVLENLLSNYDSSQLPNQCTVGPTVVATNILIRSMGPISETDMDYSMDCYFRQSWRDPRLSFPGPVKSLSLSIKMLERIWRPDTYFYNGKFSYVHTITVPNKLLRISQHGDILYSMRLTIKANCPMKLRNFPMDSQKCPLVFGSYAHNSNTVVYQWQSIDSVSFVPGMTLSQFHVNRVPLQNLTFYRRNEPYSILQVEFHLQRAIGFFVIQVYVPCVLIVVLSWVSFWIHREATSDRIALGITTVLTLSTISLDSRIDLPKVRYATALDWFLLMSFFYCIATLLEFAGVHYFTKVGSGEMLLDEDEWNDADTELINHCRERRRSSLICPIYNNNVPQSPPCQYMRVLIEKKTQTDRRVPRWRQLLYCLVGNDEFRRQRQQQCRVGKHVNSTSRIDQVARILFPVSFISLNFIYWHAYIYGGNEISSSQV